MNNNNTRKHKNKTNNKPILSNKNNILYTMDHNKIWQDHVRQGSAAKDRAWPYKTW